MMSFYFNSTRGHTGSLLVFNTRVVGGEDGNLHAVSPVSNSICPQRFEMQVIDRELRTFIHVKRAKRFDPVG